MPPEYVRIALTMVDGSLSIMCFITKQQRNDSDPGWMRDPSPENIDAEIKKSRLPVASWRIVSKNADDVAEFPEHMAFRDAWHDAGTHIDHDMAKVHAIVVERSRRGRTEKLDQLDRDWMKATGQGRKADADAVEAKRQDLRDMPVAVVAALKPATTVAEVLQVCAQLGIPLE